MKVYINTEKDLDKVNFKDWRYFTKLMGLRTLKYSHFLDIILRQYMIKEI